MGGASGQQRNGSSKAIAEAWWGIADQVLGGQRPARSLSDQVLEGHRSVSSPSHHVVDHAIDRGAVSSRTRPGPRRSRVRA